MRVAAVAGPDPGHCYPVAAVAAALAARGHQVVVVTGTQRFAELTAGGLDALELPLLAPTPRDADFGYRLWGRAGEMAGALAELLAGWGAEAVVADTLTAAGGFAAELLGLPWVEVIPHHLPDPDPDLPPVGLGARPARTPWGRADQRRLVRRQRASLAAGARLRAEVRRGLGLPPDPAPAARLVGTLPGLEYPRRRWPPRTWVVGALAWEPPGPLLTPPPGPGPAVLVADSTASGSRRSVADVAAVALGDLRAVATSTRDGPWPARWTVGRTPHGGVLPHVDVVVCSGGGGLVAKALSAGVPVVVLPEHGDQREAGRRVVWAGAGRVVWPGPAVALRLRRAVRQALRPSVRAAARRLAAGARGLGPVWAARIVERVALPGRRGGGSLARPR